MNDIWVDSSNVGSQILEGWNVMITERSTIGRSWPCLSSVDISNVMALILFIIYVGASTIIVKILRFAYDVEGRRC